MTDDLIRKDTTELTGLISTRQVSPVELTEACLRRIEALNPTLNAFLTVCGDEAMASARGGGEERRGRICRPSTAFPSP